MNNKSSDQPAHPRLISAFVIRLLKSIISRLATSEILIFKLVSVTEQTEPHFVVHPEDRISHIASHMNINMLIW